MSNPEILEKAADVHRLEGLEVKEVSLVTRPANKRVFAIVKSEDSGSGEPPVSLAPAPVLAAEPICKECGMMHPVTAACKKSEEPATQNPVSAEKAASALEQADVFLQVGDRVTVKPSAAHDASVIGKVGVIVEVSTAALAIQFPGMPVHKWYTSAELLIAPPDLEPAAKATKPENSSLVSPAAQDASAIDLVIASALPQLGEIGKRFNDMLTGISSGKMSHELGVRVVAGEISALGQSLTVLSAQMDPARPPENPYALSLAKQEEARPSPETEEVKKLGAKMAKERLERMRNAIQTLHDIIAELSTEEAARPLDGVFASDTAKAAAPPLDVSEDLRALRATLNESVKKTEQLAADLNATKQAQASVSAENLELKKKIDEQSAAMASLAKTRTGSNALPADNASAPARVEEEPASWAWDLNSSNGRHSTKKEHLFAVTDGK